MSVINGLHKEIEPIIKAAGALVLSYFHAPSVSWKRKNGGSIVTHADIEAENYLMRALRELSITASFLGEETGAHGAQEYQWVIDPIDGTSNFLNKIPYFCISIGLTHNDVTVFGAIYQPITDEYFYAYENEGAFLNGNPITVSSDNSFEQTIFLVGSPGIRLDKRAVLKKMKEESSVDFTRISYRYFGSAALDQAYIAAGRLAGMYMIYLEWWDIAAGILLIEQAGGRVSDLKGNKKTAYGNRSYLAGAPLIYNALLNTIKG